MAKRQGVAIPHLCHLDAPGYRPDGNCRACVCEIEGERVLAASCIRKPAEGMVVKTTGERSEKARAMVFELLATDMPKRQDGPDPGSRFWAWSDRVGVGASRYPGKPAHRQDNAGDARWRRRTRRARPARRLARRHRRQPDACIACGLCGAGLPQVQVNDVIGMGFRGHEMRPISISPT